MTVFCLGSINADHVYQVPHLPKPGETIAATGLATGLGGKGANQSVAAAKAGSKTIHIGAIGDDGLWAKTALAAFGVDVAHVEIASAPTGHAIINVDPRGENDIVIFSGSNQSIDPAEVMAALETGGVGDYLLIQNETNAQVMAASAAQAKGIKVVYSAAPFDVQAVSEVLGYIDMLCVNQIEADQVAKALGKSIENLGIDTVLVTKGAKGAALWHDDRWIEQPSFPVVAVDTTGAGDTFAGFLTAALEQGNIAKDALKLAAAAAAIQVTRAGAATAIPTRAEVDQFISES